MTDFVQSYGHWSTEGEQYIADLIKNTLLKFWKYHNLAYKIASESKLEGTQGRCQVNILIEEKPAVAMIVDMHEGIDDLDSDNPSNTAAQGIYQLVDMTRRYKRTSFAILTNGEFWRFYRLDPDGINGLMNVEVLRSPLLQFGHVALKGRAKHYNHYKDDERISNWSFVPDNDTDTILQRLNYVVQEISVTEPTKAAKTR